jgi:hypothetical protein
MLRAMACGAWDWDLDLGRAFFVVLWKLCQYSGLPPGGGGDHWNKRYYAHEGQSWVDDFVF